MRGSIPFARPKILAGISIAGVHVKIAVRISLAILIVVSVILTIVHRENDAERYQKRTAVRKALSDVLDIALPGPPF